MKDYGTFRRHVWAVPFELMMVGGAIAMFSRDNWLHFATSLFVLSISFAPLLLERLWQVRLPAWLQTAYVGFVFASLFAGEVLNIYGLIWEWDDIVHLVSGILIGLAVVLWLSMLVRNRNKIRLPVWLQGLFVCCFVTSMAVAWEAIEFASDQLFGTRLQAHDLFDTMIDLLYGLAGGLIIAVLLVLHLKGKRAMGLQVIVRHFERLNH